MTDIPDALGGTQVNPSYLNNKGQAVGNATLPGDIELHPFLWEKGVFTDLGTFGGTFGAATGLNEVGHVVGMATYPGDTILRAFLWKNGVKSDLGTIGSDPCSQAYAINLHGQVVGWSGFSCPGGNSGSIRAFLSENGGPMVDLNTLIPANSGISLIAASNINDRGEIAGVGLLLNGDTRAFLLIPCEEDFLNTKCSEAETASLDLRQPIPSFREIFGGTQRHLVSRGISRRFRFPGAPIGPRD